VENSRVSIGVAIALILAGVLFLLGNLGILGPIANLVWVVLFAAGGVTFLWVYAANHEHWWAIIPGFALLGLAVVVGLGETLGALAGSLFLGAIGLSFWAVYLTRREFWWAIIPGGALLTLALAAGLATGLPGAVTSGVFFLGLSATFLLVYLLAAPGMRMDWALIPAGVMGLMGVMLVGFLSNRIGIIGPLVLIVAGAFLAFRALVTRHNG
jgi:hypothetical protein